MPAASGGAREQQVAWLEGDEAAGVGDEVGGTEHQSDVWDAWRTTPSTSQPIARSGAGPPTSSGVTSHGPTGVERSQVLPCSHSSVRYCQSRIETSLATVKPAIVVGGLVAGRVAHRGADHQRVARLPSRRRPRLNWCGKCSMS